MAFTERDMSGELDLADCWDSYLRELEGRNGAALTPSSITTPRPRPRQRAAAAGDASPAGMAAPRRPQEGITKDVESRSSGTYHPACRRRPPAHQQREAASVHGIFQSRENDEGTPDQGVESPFRLNPLADNDYTFADMGGRWCK